MISRTIYLYAPHDDPSIQATSDAYRRYVMDVSEGCKHDRGLDASLTRTARGLRMLTGLDVGGGF